LINVRRVVDILKNAFSSGNLYTGTLTVARLFLLKYYILTCIQITQLFEIHSCLLCFLLLSSCLGPRVEIFISWLNFIYPFVQITSMSKHNIFFKKGTFIFITKTMLSSTCGHNCNYTQLSRSMLNSLCHETGVKFIAIKSFPHKTQS
jgi:hypothetical protein